MNQITKEGNLGKEEKKGENKFKKEDNYNVAEEKCKKKRQDENSSEE